MKEQWKDVVGYEGFYQVSNMGNVRNVENHNLHQRLQHGGYLIITLYKYRVKKDYLIHRLVAQAFIPNKLNKRYVNHIDGNKQNNCVDNLEWVTNSENMQHAIRNGLWKAPHKPIIQLKNGIEIARFESITQASEETMITRTGINNVLTGRAKTSGSYQWRYVNV